MTSTETNTEATPKRPRDASYDLIPWKGDPPITPRGGPGAVSKIGLNIASVEADPKLQGKWNILAHYGNGGTASAAKGEARKKHVDDGWEFKTARVELADATGATVTRTAVFGKYIPPTDVPPATDGSGTT